MITPNEWNEVWLEPGKALDVAVDSLSELVDYELAVVLELAGRGSLRVRRAFGPLATPKLTGHEIPLAGRTDLAAVLASGTPVLFETGEGFRDTYQGLIDLPPGHSCLAAPLAVGGRTIGLLTLDHRDCGVFTLQALRCIGILARLIALALLQSDASASLRDRNARLVAERDRLMVPGGEAFRNLAGGSAAWIRIVDSLRLVADTDSPVLLIGETGTGKEEAAKAIHRLSSRSAGPFVALNCSSLPPALAESELFGHERGSFTGAHVLRRGRFELADGGTLFLDEIGDLPAEIQPKLLRALQEGCIERLGGERETAVDIRVIAATHVDLGAAVDAGRFRADLFYRLAVFPIRLPPLRERRDDIIILAERFLEDFRSRPGWSSLRFTKEALAGLSVRAWPGNVRELRNVVERAAILAQGGLIGHAELECADGGECPCMPACDRGSDPPTSAVGRLDEVQREHIRTVLTRTGGRIYGRDGAAEILGLKPSTLQSRMKRLGLDRGEFVRTGTTPPAR